MDSKEFNSEVDRTLQLDPSDNFSRANGGVFGVILPTIRHAYTVIPISIGLGAVTSADVVVGNDPLANSSEATVAAFDKKVVTFTA